MRRKKAERRLPTPDPVYNDVLVSRFINSVMQDGKKSVAQHVVYTAITSAEEKGGEEGLELFKRAINNVAPLLEVRSRRVGGATYQVPIEVRPDRRIALAFRWLLQYARQRNDKSMASRLSAEIVAAAKGEGGAVKKKDDTHRMAEANKAFSHFNRF